jgi:hypothetical protein
VLSLPQLPLLIPAPPMAKSLFLKKYFNIYLFIYLLLTQKVHSAPITQQAEKLASHAQRESDVPVNFS